MYNGPLGGMVDAADLKSADSICRASSSLAAGTLRENSQSMICMDDLGEKTQRIQEGLIFLRGHL